MTKSELLSKIEKAKNNKTLTDSQRSDILAMYQKKLDALGENAGENPQKSELLAKIEKAKNNKTLTEKQRSEILAMYDKKLSLIDGKKDVAEVQAENKEVLKEVANVVKNDTIPAEIKPKLVAKIKEEAHASMEEEKKAIKEFAKAKTKPKKAQAKVRLEKAKERKKNVKDLAVTVSRKHDKDKFKDLMKRLTDTGKYDFLKGMSKEDVERDMQRLAKPMGWRFRGKGNYKNPNRAEIKAGIKTGKVYYETRPERSDVSKTVRLAKGSTIAGASSFDSWLKENNIDVYKRTYYWVADDGKGDYRHVGTKAEVMKALKDEFIQSTQKMATGGAVGKNKASNFKRGQYVWCEEQGGITTALLSQNAFLENFEELKSQTDLKLVIDNENLKVFEKENGKRYTLRLKEIYS